MGCREGPSPSQTNSSALTSTDRRIFVWPSVRAMFRGRHSGHRDITRFVNKSIKAKGMREYQLVDVCSVPMMTYDRANKVAGYEHERNSLGRTLWAGAFCLVQSRRR